MLRGTNCFVSSTWDMAKLPFVIPDRPRKRT